MKVAVASSGLGHIARGIEAWALDTAAALAGRDVDVTLFAAGDVESSADSLKVVSLPSLRRYDEATQRKVERTPSWAWRWGLKDAYGLEQFSFWRHLRPHLKRGNYDILHVQDPMVARWCRRYRAWGLVRTREILAHGTEESVDFLAPLDYVQQLAPWHLDESTRELNARGTARPNWVAIPNFVDTDVFHPPDSAEEQAACRQRLGLPAEGILVGCVAAVKKHHKRIDYLVNEFRKLARGTDGINLVVAGSKQQDTEALIELANTAAPGRIQILTDLPRSAMPNLYRSLDVFVLTSLFEMMPIAVLESLASQVPVVANRHPVLEWMVGEGGTHLDMGADGALAGFLASLSRDWIASAGEAARERAVTAFSRDSVIDAYINYYSRVAQA